jgi:hypothetical protein
MAEAKPFASLSSSLLARKGQAKPAMRPQGFNGFGQFSGTGASPEDLGWNDMGFDLPRPSLPLTPAEPVGLDGAPVEPEPQPVPPVVAQREELNEVFAPAPSDVTPLLSKPKVRTVSRAKPAADRKAKAAFTLRLDADRHLKLRLACAMQNRSAQQLVTEALDQFLASLPDLDGVAERVPAASNG